MKRFRFPLRPVAVMRADRELRAREALAAAIEGVRLAQEKVLAARGRISGLEAVMRAGRSGTFRAAEAVAAGLAYRRECGAELEAQKQLAGAHAAMEKRRGACIEANRDLKVISKLEEKARTRHRDESQRAEQVEIDEIALRRSAQRRLPLS
ncbi:MAG TPA: flagellar export protein FliJ [Opitutaceae bacterium]|nr:flagellar export protein FliJ [Opitutaceae bacterium]